MSGLKKDWQPAISYPYSPKGQKTTIQESNIQPRYHSLRRENQRYLHTGKKTTTANKQKEQQ